ncbi:hypothetical protein [Erwinia phage vB_Ea277G]|nr:hypothetical protein [Erwinia phage vB_Ea277G]
MSSFLHRVEVFSFDTNLSRREIREFVRRYLDEFTVSEAIKMATEAVMAYEKAPDSGWFEDLQDAVEEVLRHVYRDEKIFLMDHLQDLSEERANSICDLCAVIEPGLLGSLDHFNFNFRRMDYEVQGAELLGVGIAVSIAVER